MKKSSTAVAESKRNFHQRLTIGLDLRKPSPGMVQAFGCFRSESIALLPLFQPSA